MKCRHCGNKVLGEAKYCTLCGNPVDGSKTIVTRTVVENPIEEMSKEKEQGRKLYYDNNTRRYGGSVGNNTTSKGGIGCLIVFLIVFFLPFIGVFVGVFSFFDSFQSEEYVEFGEDMIPTIYEVLGNKSSICSYSSTSYDMEEKLIVEYCEDEVSLEDYNEYVNYLIDSEDFYDVEAHGVRILRKDSLDDNLEIVININYDTNTITYEKRYVSDDYEY